MTQRLGRLMVPEIYIAFNYFKKHFAPDSTYTDSMILKSTGILSGITQL